VKNRFQSSPFKCNLHRYNEKRVHTLDRAEHREQKLRGRVVRLCTLESS
jgi:hypothetical protein